MKNTIIFLLLCFIVWDTLSYHPDRVKYIIDILKGERNIVEQSSVLHTRAGIDIHNDYCVSSSTGGHRTLSSIKYIVWHSTGNNNHYADAKFHKNYQDTTDKRVSWHYTIDDTGVYKNHEEDMITYHSGDRQYNAESIGIEICQFDGIDTLSTIRYADGLYTYLSNLYPDAKHITHEDVTGKKCPSFNPLKTMLDERNGTNSRTTGSYQ